MRQTTPNKISTKPAFQKHPLAVAIHLACGAMLGAMPLAQAAPTGGAVVGGTGTISQSGTNTTINQSSQNLAINWQSFNVAADERVQFIQPNSQSIALNRILSNDGSVIAGHIDSNGRVILANANGILFTSTASLNVGSIIASGLDISPTDFMNGQYVFHDIAGTSGKVVNNGMINASLGGNVALIGKQVQNNGLIVAKLGSVTLAAGKQAVLTFDNAGLLGVRITEAMLQDELGVDPAVLNSGTIQAEGGRVLLTASQSQDVFSRAVNTNGAEAATSVVVNADGTFTLGSGADVANSGTINTSGTQTNQNGGQIVLLGDNVTSSGILKADAQNGNGGEIELNSTNTTMLTQNSMTSARSESNGQGGIVKVLGDKVGLFDYSVVDVSGANGGGQALIGGDQSGMNSAINNANFIYLSDGSQVLADGLDSGNGGKIITFAKDTARIYGTLSARGGMNGGNGGFIETSGLQGFELTKTPDAGTSTSAGLGGAWLIDPYNITISSGTQSGITASTGAFTANTNSATLDVANINSALAGGTNVTVSTGSSGTQAGNITLSSSADINYDNGSARTLTLNAAGDIVFQAGSRIYDNNPTNNSNSDMLSVTLNAGLGGVTGTVQLDATASIVTQGGSFKVGSSASPITGNFVNDGTINTTGGINKNGGDIQIYAAGTVTSSTALLANGGTAQQSNGGVPGRNGGNITISAGGTVSLADVSAQGTKGDFNNSDVGGQSGGKGGALDIVSISDGITVSGLINTSGGDGSGDNQTSTSADPASGGNAGSIALRATNGAINLAGISANGGTGIGQAIPSVSVSSPSGGNGGTIGIVGSTIQLNGDIGSLGGLPELGSTIVTRGNGGDLNFTGSVIVGNAVAFDTSGSTGGNIRFDGTLDGLSGTAYNLTLTGKDVTFNSAVGGVNRLGMLTIDATNAVNATNTIAANALAVTQSTSFSSGSIDTSGVSVAGGAVSILSQDITVGAINTSSTSSTGGAVTLTATDNTVNGTPSIRLNGDVNASGSSTGTVQLSLIGGTSATGNVTVAYTGDFTSTVNVTGSAGTDTLLAANRLNSWDVSWQSGQNFNGSLNGNSTPGITFTNIDRLVGNANTDTFVITGTNVAGGFIDGGAGTGADTLDMTALTTGSSVTLASTNTSGKLQVANLSGISANSALNNNTLIGGDGANTWTIDSGANMPYDGNINNTTSFKGFKTLQGGSGKDQFDVKSAFVGTLNGGDDDDTFNVAAQITGNLNGGAGNDTFSMQSGGAVSGTIDGGSNPVGSSADSDTLNLLANADVYIGGSAGGFNILNIENLTSTNGVLHANTSASTTWTIDGADSGKVSDGTNNLTFTGFGDLFGSNAGDTYNVTNNGSLSGAITAGNGGNTLDITVSQTRQAGQIYYKGGSGTDAVTVHGTTSTVTYDPSIAGYDRLSYTGTNGTLAVNYSGSSSVTDSVSAGTLIVNGTAASDAITLSSSAFNVNGRPTVNYSNKTGLIVQGDTTNTDSITINGDLNLAGGLTLKNADTLTATGVLSATDLVLDNIVAFNTASPDPMLNTSITSLSLTRSGTVAINQTGGLQLNQINTAGPFTVKATGNITETSASLIDVGGPTTLSTTGNIVLNIAGQNTFTGALDLFGSAIDINNGVATNLAAVTAASLRVASAGDITQSGTNPIVVSGLTTLSAQGRSIALNNAGNDFNSLNVTAAANASITDVDRINSGSITAGSVTLNTNNGVGTAVGAFNTNTGRLVVNNNTDGGVYITNNGTATVSIVNHGEIGLTNNGNLTIDKLYTDGTNTIYPAIGTQSPFSTVSLTVSGGIQAYQGAPSYPGLTTHSAEAAPDITADTLTLQSSGAVGSPVRNLSVEVSSTFNYFGPPGAYVYFYGGVPPIVTNPGDLNTRSAADVISSQQLLEVESLGDFDPAIFTAVRNYYYEDVAIKMPEDQRMDGQDKDEDEDKNEDKNKDKAIDGAGDGKG